jgi:hypothetical protein
MWNSSGGAFFIVYINLNTRNWTIDKTLIFHFKVIPFYNCKVAKCLKNISNLRKIMILEEFGAFAAVQKNILSL